MIQHAQFAFGLGVRGHFHIAYLLTALLTLPFIPIDGALSAGFTKGSRLCRLGEFGRDLVELFLTTPFHAETVELRIKGKTSHDLAKH